MNHGVMIKSRCWIPPIIKAWRIPTSMKSFKMHLLPKKDGAKDPSHFRPLNVGNLLRRMFSSIITDRMSVHLRQNVGQMGFQRGNEGVFLNVELLRHCLRQNVKKDKEYLMLIWTCARHSTQLSIPPCSRYWL